MVRSFQSPNKRIVFDPKRHCIRLHGQRSVGQSRLKAWITSAVLRATFSVSSNVSAVCCHTCVIYWFAPLSAREDDPDQPP